MTTDSRSKDPARVAIGRAAMRKRWGPPVTIDLRGEPPEVREFLTELVAVARRNEARRAAAEPR